MLLETVITPRRSSQDSGDCSLYCLSITPLVEGRLCWSMTGLDKAALKSA
jgi:hypothetical protein